MIIVVASLKGGVGKTTTAVCLASVAAGGEDAGALLLDADPQASARRWAEAAHEDGLDLRCHVAPWTAGPDARALYGDKYPTIVVDTPPGDLVTVTMAMAVADVVLIPCRPTLVDVERVRVTVDVAASAHRPAAILLCQTFPNTRALAAARHALDAAELPVLDAEIPHRQAIAASYGQRPVGLASYYHSVVLAELEAAIPT